MAATFTLRIDGAALTVKRKFLFKNQNSINFVDVIPAASNDPKSKAWHHCRHLPSSGHELTWFPEKQQDLELAAQQLDKKRLKVSIPDHPEIRTVEDLRRHAEATGIVKGQARRRDEISNALTGFTHSPLIEKLRAQVIEQFFAAFDGIRLYDPTEPGAREFIFGYNIAAEQSVVATLARLASQGHAYSQFLSGLLAASKDDILTSRAVQFFLEAHDQGLPQALPALAERLLAERYFSDALQCAAIAVAGGYAEARSVIDDVGRATAHALLETPRGMVGFFQYLVEQEIDPGVRELLMEQRPEWRPKTHEEVLAAMFARQRGGNNHV